MKVAVVEKFKTGAYDPYKEYFNFEYDRFALTKSKKTKILKRDITLTEDFSEYDYVICVGSEAAKFIAKVTNVTKYAGHLVDNKYIPILNPMAVRFNPGIKDTFEASIKKLHSHIDGTYEELLGDYKGITCAQDAISYLEKILHDPKCKKIVVDIETSALYPRDGYVLGIAITHKSMFGVYIDSDCIDDNVEYLLEQLFLTKTCIFHNAKFDIKWLEYHFNFRFPNFLDTMIEHYILNENEAHDLKSLVLKYTKMGDYDRELVDFKASYIKRHKIKVAEFSYDFIPFDVMYPYACGDVDGTMRLHEKFGPIVDQHFNKLYHGLMLPATEFLKNMENTGVPFSREALNNANVILSQKIFDLKEKLYEFEEIKQVEKTLSVKFNPNSTAHLRMLFFDILKLPSTKKTDGGLASTDASVLDELAELHPVSAIIKQIRQTVKLKSTYIDKVLIGLDSDQRLRTGFHLHTVSSGRLSSSGKLNMQQLPRDDATVKSCIVSILHGELTDDWVIFSQDLQTAEMYYAAVLSKDRNLAKVFSSGGDFHSTIAKMTFGLTCPVEEVKTKHPELRQAAKAVSFGILYGAGAGKVAKTANISFKEAKSIIKRYFDTFNQLKIWLDNTSNVIATNGYIYSAFGRKRRVQNVFSVDDYEQGHALRSALNFTIQSVASDVNLLAAIDTANRFKEENVDAEIFALVHDSIVGMCHKDSIEATQTILRECTQKDRGVSIPNCPIKVDFGYGANYKEAS